MFDMLTLRKHSRPHTSVHTQSSDERGYFGTETQAQLIFFPLWDQFTLHDTTSQQNESIKTGSDER